VENKQFVTVNNVKVPLEGEKNILELLRKININLPTFCYHSELSVYGACRLCVVEVEGRGVMAACSTSPWPEMVIKTHSSELRKIRKMSIELLLAGHDQSCPTCHRSDSCKLRMLASQFGIEKSRFLSKKKEEALDYSSPSLVRDPNKCVLCGDCVRFCREVQGIGVLDFAHRGPNAKVCTAFDQGIGGTECINCGGCATVCPTGAIAPAYQHDAVWDILSDSSKLVVAQVAPAVRSTIGEMFGFKEGTDLTGKMTSALRLVGFQKVYDTAFAADLTVLEEAKEFLDKFVNGKKLPLFTSCCPAWVKYAEQYLPEKLDQVSTCKSPQQMFGSVLKDYLARELGKRREDIVVVSVMPCTAKKFEAKRDEFKVDGNPDVDYVITTHELGLMIKEAGIRMEELESSAMDMPMGLGSGSALLFGNSGGVTEAVVRHLGRAVGPVENVEKDSSVKGVVKIAAEVAGKKVKLAVVQGLNALNSLLESGEEFHLVEVMACPGGCIGGAGAPQSEKQRKELIEARTEGLANIDRQNVLKTANDNPFVAKVHAELSQDEHRVHKLLHTHYHARTRVQEEGVSVLKGEEGALEVKVCIGTGCFLKGSQDLLKELLNSAETQSWGKRVDIKATFCMEKCGTGPNVLVDGESVPLATIDKLVASIDGKLAQKVKV